MTESAELVYLRRLAKAIRAEFANLRRELFDLERTQSQVLAELGTLRTLVEDREPGAPADRPAEPRTKGTDGNGSG
jgi:hypothetical protein